MASPDPAIDFVLVNEGGFVNDPLDAGGATNGGISLRFLQSLTTERLAYYGISGTLTALTIEQLTDEQIHLIYLCEFWSAARFKDIVSQRLANYIFDMAVNFGISEAIKTAQRSYNSLAQAFNITVDGKLGEQTLSALNGAPADHLVTALPIQRVKLLRAIVLENPTDARFLAGWIIRANRI